MVQPLINIPGATNAQQRAAQHLQNSYGQRAAASINAIQNTAGGGAAQHAQPQQQQGPPNPQLQYQPQLMQNQQQPQQMHLPQQQQRPQGVPNQGMPQNQGQQSQMSQQAAQAQYRAMLARDAANRQAALQQQQQQPTIKQAQNDGAADEVETVNVIRQFDAAGNEIGMGRVEIDSMIRQRILANARTMEGGGLMVPLKEASTKSSRQRKVPKRQRGPLGGGDANDDDDDIKDDEDAINSDLDDPDDGLNEDEDDDDQGQHIMLCMYDKVQRVKNKW